MALIAAEWKSMSTHCSIASTIRTPVGVSRLGNPLLLPARHGVLARISRRISKEVISLKVRRDGVSVKGWTKGTRRMAVHALWGKVELPKPTFVALEQIAGEEQFNQVLSESQQRNQPIIIDWLATWCRKCIYLKPKLEKLAAEYHPNIKFYYVDVNTVPQALVKRAEVTKMPTIQLWQDGERKAEVIGGHQAWLVLDEIRDMIKSNK